MNMNFDEYQAWAASAKCYPTIGAVYFTTLGLNGEAGEVAEKVKKVMRDESGQFTKESVDEIKKELGDVLWYLANLSSELGISLSDVAKTNMDKVNSRYDRGVVHGSGDNR